jgi:hypothetical protein
VSIEIRIVGPDAVGCPCVIMSSGDGYNPDTAEDLKNRAVEAYTAMFGDIYNEPFFQHATEEEDEEEDAE